MTNSEKRDLRHVPIAASIAAAITGVPGQNPATQGRRRTVRRGLAAIFRGLKLTK